MSIFRHFQIALRLAFKAKFSWMAIVVLLTVALATLLSAYFGGRQPVTVALDVGFSVMRLLLPLVIVLLVQDLISREFDKRYYLNSLTYPDARSNMLVGRCLAVSFLVLCLLFALGILQVWLTGIVSSFYPQATSVVLGQSYVIVMAFFWIDLLVLTGFSAVLAVFASTPSFVLVGTFGFMLVARSYGAIIDLLGQGGELVSHAEGYRSTLGILSYFLPDLGALDVRMIALYGKSNFLSSDWPWFILSNLAYAMAMLAFSVWLLQRKRFS